MAFCKANMLFVLLASYTCIFNIGADAKKLLMQTLSKVLSLETRFDNLENKFMKSVTDVNSLDKRMDNMEMHLKNSLTDLHTKLAEGLKRNAETQNDYKPKLGGITKSIESTISNTVTRMVKSQYIAISTAMKREKVALKSLKTEIKNHIKEMDDVFQNAETSFEERLSNQSKAQEYKFERQSDLEEFISDVREQLKGNFSDVHKSLDKAIEAFNVDMKNTTFNIEKTLNENLVTVQTEANLRDTNHENKIVSLNSRMSSTEESVQSYKSFTDSIRADVKSLESRVSSIETSLSATTPSAVCPAGYQCINGQAPSICPVGHYSAGNHDVCTACKEGQYSNATGSSSCTLCDGGHQCPNRGMTTPIPCSKGYVAAVGSITCTQCLESEIVLPGATSCSPCPGGYSCNGENKTMCNAGAYSPEGSSICTQCSSGTFCPVGSSNETVCITGYYSPAGATSCTICPAGYYCPNASTTFHCPTGTSSKEGSSICLEANSCYDILYKTGTHRSGVYNITTWRSHTTISVYCDMDTEGGGWTVFQRRFDGSVDFYRNFSEYENGFGSASGEYWLGLRTIQEMLSKASHELRIDVEGFSGRSGYDVYSNFRLQGPGYTFFVDYRTRSLNMTNKDLLLTGFMSTPYGQNFSTFDHDQDQYNNGNCAQLAQGAWWYNYCVSANLNGVYRRGLQGYGIHCYSFRPSDPLRLTKVMFRPSG